MRLAAVVLFLFTACASAPPHDYTAAIDASRDQMTALMAKTKAPGAAIAVTVGDHMVWHETFGVSSLETKTPLTIHSRFRVGSLTKLFTVAALMRLVEEGRAGLDDPVSKYLPDFPQGAITLRQLSGHLSGIRHYGDGEFLNQTPYASATDSLRKFAKDPLLHQPGTKYYYSSYGYDVLGAVIERATGRKFEAAVDALVFRPLKMNESSFASGTNDVSNYDASSNGPVPAPRVDLSDRLPAGAAVTTARDLARFLIGTSGRLHSSATRDTMFTLLSTSDGKPTITGIGWRVATDAQGRMFVHHGGAVTGGRAFALLYPKERVGVAIVTNLGFAQFNEREAGAIAALFLP